MPTSRSSGTQHNNLDDLRRRYVDALNVLQALSVEVHQALDAADAVVAIIREHVRNGGEVSDFAQQVDPKALRSSLSTSLDNLERARHHSQRLLFRILEAEGRSKSDIARVFGVSRQLVSRMIHEPDD